MAKLQLRLDAEQTDALIEGLGAALHLYGGPGAAHDYAKLRSWLTWRRDKVFGAPAGARAPSAADETLDELRAKLVLRGASSQVYPQRVDS